MSKDLESAGEGGWSRLQRAASLVSTLHAAVAAIVAAVVVVLLPLGGRALGLVSGSDVATTVTVALGGVLAGTAATLAHQHRTQQRRLRTPEHERGYEVLRTDCYYTIDADDPHAHHRETVVVVRALTGRMGVVEMVDDRHSWIDVADLDRPVVTSPGHDLVPGSLRRVSGWRSYQVRLRRPLAERQQDTVSVLQRIHDRNEQFESFLAKTVHDRMGLLTLTVTLPAALRPFQVWRTERRGDGPYAHEQRYLEKPARPGPGDTTPVTLTWHVREPTPGWVYELAWDYRDDGRDRSIYDVVRGEQD